MSVRHIHTQAQARAELERQRAAQTVTYARRKERMLNDTQPHTELERRRASQRMNYARRKERMLNDAEYREQELQRYKIKRDRKRNAIEEDPSPVNARNDADRMAKVRKIARETQDAGYSGARQHDRKSSSKVYISYIIS